MNDGYFHKQHKPDVCKTGESRRFQKVKAGSTVCVKVQDIAVTLGIEKLFDKLFDKGRKRKGLASDKEPIGLARCLDPNYIDCMFKKAGF